MRPSMLADLQWQKIEPFLPKLKRRRRGRPPKENRVVLEGILRVLKTGARWRDVPSDLGVSGSVCWKRLRRWDEQGVWLRIWRAFLSELDRSGKLDWQESFLDGSFAPAKKGATESAKPSVGRGTKWMVVVDGQGIPLGSQLTSASPGEARLAEPTLDAVAVPRSGPERPRMRPLRVIADKGYDSDPLRWRLAHRGILLLSPHRRNRTAPPLNDGRNLRRYRKRWKVERTFA